jgi:hypothetical protein
VGDLTHVEAVWTLAGAIAGTSAFSGTMTATRHLAGAVAGQSEFLGDLTISEALWSLAGSNGFRRRRPCGRQAARWCDRWAICPRR